MWGPGKTVNKVSWGEEDNVFQVPWLICSDLVQTGLCNFWAPNMDFTKTSLSGQQFRGKRGVRGAPIQRACHAVASRQTFSAEREEAVVFGVQSAVWTARMWACRWNSNKQWGFGVFCFFLVRGGHSDYNLWPLSNMSSYYSGCLKGLKKEKKKKKRLHSIHLPGVAEAAFFSSFRF